MSAAVSFFSMYKSLKYDVGLDFQLVYISKLANLTTPYAFLECCDIQ